MSKELTPQQSVYKLTAKQISLPWAIYIRVSTKDQGEKYSPASQRKTLLAKAAELDIYVPEDFILIDKRTGKNEDRPDFQRLKELAANKQIGGFFALCLDRVARDVVNAILVRREFKREGAAIVFALQQFDDSPAGKFMYTQFAAIAEYEADIIVSRTAKGRLEKAQRGVPVGGLVGLFGFQYHPGRRLPGGVHCPGYLTEHETETAIVQRCMKDYASHGSTHKIQVWLNEQGISTRRGKVWCSGSVIRMLRNTSYIGQATANVKGEDLIPQAVTMKAPAIVSPALFNKVQVLLAAGKARAGRPSKDRYLLTRLIFCRCKRPDGEACKRRWTNRYRDFYSCAAHYPMPGTSESFCPDSTSLHSARFDAAVLDGVRNRLRDPKLVYQLARDFHAAKNRGAGDEKESFETRRTRLKRSYDRNEGIVFSDVPQRTRDKAAAQLKQIEADLRALEVEERDAAVVALPSRDSIEETARRLALGIDGLRTFEEKRKFLLETVERVETDGRTYTVSCRIELEAESESKTGPDSESKNTCVDRNGRKYFAFTFGGRVA